MADMILSLFVTGVAQSIRICKTADRFACAIQTKCSAYTCREQKEADIYFCK